MAKKMKQITDSIHGTIYLSKLESELISTPYFYRLHDIYQSSTVYMTFPVNRTKRYEHSLGTMELASSMLFSSLSNADNDTKVAFFKKLNYHFKEIFDLAFLQSGSITAPYFTKCQSCLNDIFSRINLSEDTETGIPKIIDENLRKSIENGCFNDLALDNFQFYPMTVYTVGIGDDARNFFLYRCILQAVRIVSLFHDVGHPPYSHIIESELSSLYEKVMNEDMTEIWNQKRVNEFKKILKPYATKNDADAYKCQTIYSQSSSVDSQLHERIGLSLLQSTINDVIPEQILKIANSGEKVYDIVAKSLYHILVTEFTIAILVEKDIFFKSLHKLVDGIIDADRLDYIVRDSLNSGVDWGKIPYKRLINSSKLIWLKEKEHGEVIDEDERPFIVAYPMKVADDIVELLMMRYKIFVRINFHHRCMKTTVALQSAVRDLAENYLKSIAKSDDCIVDDINILWNALQLAIGERTMRIIQWNDSWLITVLHHALIKLNTMPNCQHKILRENLEEILLNRKRYYSLIKRGIDSKKVVDKVLERIGLSDEVLNKLLERERNKYYSCKDELEEEDKLLTSSRNNAFEAIKRIRRLQELLENGDMELLDSMLPPIGTGKDSLLALMETTMERIKNEGRIEDYKAIINKARRKTGMPSHRNVFGEIYLYSENAITTLDEDSVLRPQIETLEKNSPWIFLYYVPPRTIENTTELENYILDEMVKDIGDNLKDRFSELFSSVL